MSARRRTKHLKAVLKGSPEPMFPADFMSCEAMTKGGLNLGKRY